MNPTDFFTVITFEILNKNVWTISDGLPQNWYKRSHFSPDELQTLGLTQAVVTKQTIILTEYD